MERLERFPTIKVEKGDSVFEGVAGIEMKSILKGELLIHTDETRKVVRIRGAEALRDAREGLLQTLSAWPENVVLELRLTSLPDLARRVRGRIMITLFLRVFGASDEETRETLIARYLALMPLLAAHLPEAEFAPITIKHDLERLLNPFRPVDALALLRKREVLSLNAPLKRVALGFGSDEVMRPHGNGRVSHVYPWIPTGNDWSRLLDTLMGLLDPLQIIVRMKNSLKKDMAINRLEETIHVCDRFLSQVKPEKVLPAQHAGLIRELSLGRFSSLKGELFDLGVFILAPHTVDYSLGMLLGGAITGNGFSEDGRNVYKGGFDMRPVWAQKALRADYFLEEEPFTISEAACVFRLPSPPFDESIGLPVKRSRTGFAMLPPVPSRDGAIELFVNEHRGIAQPVTMDPDDRMTHAFVLGATGTGKSTLMESWILQDIRAGRGVAVIDPHGELVEEILGKIPRERMEDVILFDALDRNRPIGFNILEWRTEEERDIIIDDLYLTFDRIYDMKATGGPIFETYMRGSLRAITGDSPKGDFVATILELPLFYLEKGFRKWLKNRTNDPQILDFLEELERAGGDAHINNVSPYITSKFVRFLHDTTLRRIVGQERTGFDFDAILNERKIFLVNLGKGRLGSAACAMLANQLVSRFKLAAMRRGDLETAQREDFFVYVDEAHNLPSENFCELLAEARKYRMGLVLSTQHMAQLREGGKEGGDLLSAILGNVGTFVLMRLGQEDSQKLASAVHPHFGSSDIVALPNWKGYARIQMGADTVPPFSFRSIRDRTPYSADIASEIREVSRKKYGQDIESIERGILKRRRIWKEETHDHEG